MRIKTLKEFPFHLLSQTIAENKDATKDFFKEVKLTPSLMSQAYAYIATMREFKHTDTGLLDGSKYIGDNFPRDDWHIGFYYMLMTDPRGNLFPGIKQTGKEYLPYCGLVPLIMAAHKLINGISYESWDKTTLKRIVNKSLLEVMEIGNQYTGYSFTTEELLDARNSGLVYINGPLAGKPKNPATTYRLNGLVAKQQNAELLIGWDFTDVLPTLAQTILTQIWAAHPTNRNELMILDLYNWDTMPEPLEDAKVLIKAEKQIPEVLDKLPWDI